MTFTNALKRLAEKEPGKFEFFENLDNDPFSHAFESKPIDGSKYNNKVLWIVSREGPKEEHLTQDDIDEILALIGWEYEVARFNEDSWGYMARQNSFTKRYLSGGGDKNVEFPTKLEAAKAALIAVVEKEYS